MSLRNWNFISNASGTDKRQVQNILVVVITNKLPLPLYVLSP